MGGPGSGKTLLLKLVTDSKFNQDSVLFPMVWVNIYFKEMRCGKKVVSVSISEFGVKLAPLWVEYFKPDA